MIETCSSINIFKGFDGLEINIFHEYNYIIEILLNEYLNSIAVEKIFNQKKLSFFRYLRVNNEIIIHQISGKGSVYPKPILIKKF